MYPLIQSKVWKVLGKVEETLPFLLEALIQTAVENGLGSQHTEVAANTAITLASVNQNLVAGKTISRLRKVLRITTQSPAQSLVFHPLMGEISSIVRFLLMLSFNDRLNVCQYLPELCHVISLLAGVGSPVIRSSIHGITVNTIQSLCTISSLDEINRNTLRLLLSDFSEPKMCLLFGLSGTGMVQHGAAGWFSNTSNNAFLLSSEAVSGDIQRDMPLASVETIINGLLDVMSHGTSDPGNTKMFALISPILSLSSLRPLLELESSMDVIDCWLVLSVQPFHSTEILYCIGLSSS